jgi:hypothetical protein
VPPDATGQDFTGTDVSTLTARIQRVTAEADDQLGQMLAEANDIAQDGDYFSVAKDTVRISLIVDAMMGGVDVLGESVDTVERVQDLTKVQFPGVPGRGWEHVVTLKTTSEPARDAFRSTLQQPVSASNAQRAAKELFNGAHVYYAAGMADESAEELTGGMVKEAWASGLQSGLALQTQLYAAQQRLVDDFSQDITDTGAETIASIPYMTPAMQQMYVTDLALREKANDVMALTLAHRILPLHLARDAREDDQDDWLTEFLAKFLLKKLGALLADGPGALAVEAGSTGWDMYQDIRGLQEDLRLMTMAAEGMGGALDAEKRIYLNTVNGLDNVAQRIDPHIAQGEVASLTNKSEGEYKLFGRWFWCEQSSYTEVDLSNPTNYDTAYQAIAEYGKTGFLGTGYQSLVSEGAQAIPGGSSDAVRVYYKQDDKGASPDEESVIGLDLLGSTDTGTYHILHENVTWSPMRVTASGDVHLMMQTQQQDAPAIPYPIRTRVVGREDTLTYTPYIWVDNPFTHSVTITLTQPLPAGVEVLDDNNGTAKLNTLRWQQIISPQTTVVITHLIRYQGEAGRAVQYPDPELEMASLTSTDSVTFTGKGETFTSQPPLDATGDPPLAIYRGESVTIPLTVTNRMSDSVASGTVTLRVVDFEAEMEVYSATTRVTVEAGDDALVEMRLDATDIPSGDHLLTAVVMSNGGQEEVFSEYIAVRPRAVYLPLVLRNQ